jgi:Tol biopolymer transport system component
VASCRYVSYESDLKSRIVKVTDFEISPDESKIAFSALTPVGNSDIWVVNIDGTGLKKLTFKDWSPSNHIAKFFKKRGWRNFFEINMHSPEWTKEGRIMFCEEITRYHSYGANSAGLRYLTMEINGDGKRIKTNNDQIAKRKPFDLVNRSIISDYSDRHKKKIFLKDNILWILDYKETNPKKLI